MLFKSTTPGEEIVISGISGIFPSSKNVHEFRDNLFNKVLKVSSESRWDNYKHSELPKRSGIIPDVNKFDAGFFGVHERQSQSSDPMLRILQEKAVEAIFDAGLHPSDLENTMTGVYIGSCYSETEIVMFRDKLLPQNYSWTGCARSMQAHRLSYFLKLKGPSVVTDSACSSSLYALEHAFRALMLGEIDNAIVCGTNVVLHPFITLEFARLGVLSDDASCKVFDQSANGYVRSEAIVAILLQRTKNAKRVYAQVVHAKTNCDGFKDKGVHCPGEEGQASLLKQFYDECNVDHTRLNYMEAHGTGTLVGDPIECSAIDEVLTKNRKTPLLIGSFKSVVGHTEAASGVCSIIKCIIAMETGFIPPNINFNVPNEKINGLVEGRLKVVTDKMPFEDKGGLVALNSFGFGGANCHVLLRWNPKEKMNSGLPNDDIPRLVCMSGRTEEAVTNLFDELGQNELDAEHIKLLHNIFRKDIKNHIYRGYTIVSKSGEIATSLKYFDGNLKPLYFAFGELINWCEVGNDLMILPVFANSIQRTQKIVSKKGINISNILLNKTNDSETVQVLGSVVVQIAIMDTLKLLEIKPAYCFGYSFGVLVAALCNGNITLEEALECAIVINQYVNDINGLYKSNSNNVKKQENYTVSGNDIINGNISFNDIDTKLNKLKEVLRSEKRTGQKTNLKESLTNVFAKPKSELGATLKSRYQTGDYYIEALMNNYFKQYDCIQSNYIVFKIGCSPMQKQDESITVISSLSYENGNCLIGLLKRFGSLYEYGYNPQLHKLYPTIDLPVSRGTRMISPYIKWNHNRDWFVSKHQVETNFATKAFKIQSHDLEWKFLNGYIIDGRNLFPAAGYLYLVWETLSSVNGLPMSVTKVAFENCKFIRITSLPSNSELKMSVSIQEGTGNFEILEGYSLVATGRIYLLKNDEQGEAPSGLSNDYSCSLQGNDVYKELRLRGYNYKDEFYGIQGCDDSASKAYIRWSANWISFIDNMIQLKTLQFDTRSLYLPTHIAKLTINPQTHMELIDQYPTDYPNLPVVNNQLTGIISSGGVHISGVTATPLSRKHNLGSPVLEGYKFVPNIASLTTEESVRVNMQIISENTLTHRVKVVELVDDYSESTTYLTPIILSVLEDQPLMQPFLKILSKASIEVNVEVEDKELSSERDCLLVIGTSILARPDVFRNALKALQEKGFILSREQRDFDASSVDNVNTEIITIHKTRTESLVLVRNCSYVRKTIGFKIGPTNSFSWVPKLKQIITKHANDDIVIYSENEPNSGILGLVNCLRKEQKGQNVRCIFVADAGEVDLHAPRYASQLKKDMAINVYKTGQWGTYRYLVLDKIEDAESEHCLAKIEMRGDSTSVRWIEGPLQDVVIPPENKLAYVYYAALNFKDLLTALGKIEVNINRREQQCIQEYSGRDEKGNRIMGIVHSEALSTLVLFDSKLTYKVPDDWTLEEAATVPLVYLSAIYAIYIRGSLKHGDKILIHTGTGGVGQAAIRLALSSGCTVFTTVGSDAKRDFLKRTFPQLKDHHIGNSRDESFEQMILKETKGTGVDVVLNSLAEEKLLASVRCLARGGRFIEIGKMDLVSNNQLNLLLLKRDASYQAINMDMVFKQCSLKHLLSKFMNNGLQSGVIKPLNRSVFKFEEAEKAIRLMTSGKHMGKVLLEIRKPENELVALPAFQRFNCIPRYWCDPEMVYIIVGGLGGIGLELADWLVLRGAKKIVLTSRTGISTGYQKYRIRKWKSYGTMVKIAKSDITLKPSCEKVIEQSKEFGAINTIFNLAGVFNACSFENETPDTFAATFEPKVLATQYLDELSRKLCPNLRDFVVFSSIVSGRGNGGQTNYAMANSAMERICEQRRQDGYPALTIEWGPIADVGMVGDWQEDQTPIPGILLQQVSSCLEVLDTLLKQKSEVIVSSLVLAEKQEGIKSPDSIVEAVANVLGINDLNLVSLQSTLAELGMDSITIVQIRQILERDFNINITARDLRTMTLARLKEIPRETDVVDNRQYDANNNETNDELSIILKAISAQSENNLPVRMKSKVDETTLAPKLLLFPGIGGLARVFESFALNLNAHTYCVQYSHYDAEFTVEYTAKSVLPYVEDCITKTEPFTFLAYSYGVFVALEVVHLLEAKGYTGTILCLDGSPVMSKSEKEVVFISKYWKDRLNLLTNVTKHKSISEENYHKIFTSVLYKRIKGFEIYNHSYSNLKSKAVLYKAKEAAMQGLSYDYKLSQLFENLVDVQTFEGNHVTILFNRSLTETINSFIREIPLKQY